MVTTAEWHWVSDARRDLDPAERFPTQGEAETWLGETYPDLLAADVRAVSLYEGERRVYGPMRLDES